MLSSRPRSKASRRRRKKPEINRVEALVTAFGAKLLRALNARFRQLGPVGVMQNHGDAEMRHDRHGVKIVTSFCVIVTHRTGRLLVLCPNVAGPPALDLGMGRGGGLSLAGENKSPPLLALSTVLQLARTRAGQRRSSQPSSALPP